MHTACGATCSEQKEKANAGHQLGINQNSSSAVPSSCSRKSFSYENWKCFLLQSRTACARPSVHQPWELPSARTLREDKLPFPRGRHSFQQLTAPLAARHRTQQLVRVPARANYNSLTCLGASMHGNALAPGCQMLESYKWETFGERKN